ncbi:hypothetical protein B566_EDAN004303 [Ephemera danica]|nr:hypothetical protein B566_EDAN004303 [Ephemera danica]
MEGVLYINRSKCKAQKSLRRKLLVVWDIENCPVPKGISASSVVKKIRQMFLKTYTEYRFVVACDITKLKELIRVELSDAQVEMLHVESTCKNAADTVLKLQLQNFGCYYSCMGAAALLISSDVNFAPEIADLRNKRKVYVILLHKWRVNAALTQHSDEHHNFDEIVKDLPARSVMQTPPKEQPKRDKFVSLMRSGSEFKDKEKARSQLERIVDSCGGKVSSLETDGAVLAFHDDTAAGRAAVRMHNEYVCGGKIKVKDFSSGTFKVDTSDSESSGEDTMKLIATKSCVKCARVNR